MSVNETEGMIKVRVAWMRGGCVWMDCMRARACVYGVCVREYLNLTFTYPTPSSPHSPIPLRPIHSSTPPPLRLSPLPYDDQGVGARGDGPNSWYPYYRCQRRRTYRRRGPRDGVRPTAYALRPTCLSHTSQSLSQSLSQSWSRSLLALV